MRQACSKCVGIREKPNLLRGRFGVLNGGNVTREDVRIIGIQRKSATSLGDARQQYRVGVHIPPFKIELWKNFDDDGFLRDRGIGVEQSFHFRA